MQNSHLLGPQVFDVPSVALSRRSRATGISLTHKGEWLQGPIPIVVDGVERYTMGIYSLQDNLNSAYVEVRKAFDPASDGETPGVTIARSSWNIGEMSLILKAVLETWREVGNRERCHYTVYGLHDIRVGAGSGSSSALVQAVIRATAGEHISDLSDAQLEAIHARVESGRDGLNQKMPAITASRYPLGRPIKVIGHRPPCLKAVTWSAGEPKITSTVEFRYTPEELLLWRVRWASLERAVRSEDDARVARLATESAREGHEKRFKMADFELLEQAISDFGALGFAIAHTGSYHVALFSSTGSEDEVDRFKAHVLLHSKHIHDGKIESFDTAEAARERWKQ